MAKKPQTNQNRTNTTQKNPYTIYPKTQTDLIFQREETTNDTEK